MSRHAGDKTKIWTGRLIRLIVLLAVAYGAYWTFVNWDYIRDRGRAKYEVERYGILWRTNFRYAKEFAQEHNREILLVYLNSGTDNEPSNRLIRSIFPSRSFLAAAQTYIPLLCDIRNGVEENARIRSNQSELMKEFSLGTGYGPLIRLDSNGRELERVQFTDQRAVELINRIAGGKFVALPPIQRPEIKDPVKEKVSEGMDKAKSMVSGEGTISGDPAPVPTAPARP